MKIYIGVTKDDGLYYIEWDKVDNEHRKTFSLTGGTYNDPKTETQGEDEARERLKDSEYWEDLGILDKKSFLMDFIDFDQVADHVINIDGWEMTNGEYSHFGEYEGEKIYLNSSSCGQHQEEIKDLKECWVNEGDLKTIYEFWDKDHLKPLKKIHINFMDSFFEKNKDLCSDQEVLIKYLKTIEWQQ